MNNVPLNSDKKVLLSLKDLGWFAWVLVVGAGVFFTLRSQVQQNTQGVEDFREHEKCYHELDKKVTKMNNNDTWIINTLTEIKEDIRQIKENE